MTVYKSPATGPDPLYSYESWVTYVESELAPAFAAYCVTYPVAHWNSQMSAPIMITAPGAILYGTAVAKLKVPH